MKHLGKKLFLGAAVMFMGFAVSCKDKDKNNDGDVDMADTTMVDPVEPVTPATTDMDTATMPADTMAPTP